MAKTYTIRTVKAVVRANHRGEKSTVTAKRLGLIQQQVAAIMNNYKQGYYDELI